MQPVGIWLVKDRVSKELLNIVKYFCHCPHLALCILPTGHHPDKAQLLSLFYNCTCSDWAIASFPEVFWNSHMIHPAVSCHSASLELVVLPGPFVSPGGFVTLIWQLPSRLKVELEIGIFLQVTRGSRIVSQGATVHSEQKQVKWRNL